MMPVKIVGGAVNIVSNARNGKGTKQHTEEGKAAE
jgi:hypothetical protein